MAEPYFKKAFKGYDCAQVDKFIIKLSDSYTEKEKEFAERANADKIETERLKNEIARLRDEAERADGDRAVELAAQKKEYESLCAELGERMVLAEKRAAEIVRRAEREAELIKQTAQTEAENESKLVCRAAGEEAEKLVSEARAESETIRSGAEARAQELLDEAHSESEAIRRSAEEKAEGLISETESRCAEIRGAAEEFIKRHTMMQQSLYETERSFGDALSRLRGDISEKKE